MKIKQFIAHQMIRRRKRRSIPVEALETKHVDQQSPGYNDSSYFAGLSREGFSFVTRQAFRTGKHHENWLKIHVPGEGVWGFEDLPLEEGEGFVQGALKYVCHQPGELWDILYEGSVYQGDNKENIKLNLQWKSTSPIINFDDAGSDPRQVAAQIAKKPWNKAFFKRLKEIHLVHYEQGGEISGTIGWRGREHEVQLRGVRDHSFGRRNWEEWRRHIWFLGMLDDGRFFNVSVIDYDFINDLKAGFIYDGTGYITLSETPSFDDLHLEKPLPHQLEFPVKERRDKPQIMLKTKMEQFFPFIMDGVYHIRQAKAAFEYDGVPGIGIAEMGVNLKKYGSDITDR